MSEGKNNTNIINLLEEALGLRRALEELIFEKDQMDAHLLPQISAKYQSTLGVYVFKLYKLGGEINLLRKKIKAIQYLINTEQFNLDMDKYMEKETALLEEQIDAWENDLLDGIEYNNLKSLSDKEMKDIKYTYIHIITQIHPDLNPDFSEKDAKLYNIAVTAYKNSNLDELKALKLILEKDSKAQEPKSANDLQQEITSYKQSIAILKDDIKAKKESHLYKLMDLLNDKEKLEELKDNYSKEIKERESSLDYYQKKYDLTLTEYNKYGKTIN
jgi:hypothetical protein